MTDPMTDAIEAILEKAVRGGYLERCPEGFRRTSKPIPKGLIGGQMTRAEAVRLFGAAAVKEAKR